MPAQGPRLDPTGNGVESGLLYTVYMLRWEESKRGRFRSLRCSVASRVLDLRENIQQVAAPQGNFEGNRPDDSWDGAIT